MENENKVKRKPNPRKGANIFSIITYAYTFSTFLKGFRRDLQEEDVTEHLEVHASKRLGDRLENSWKKQIKFNKHPSLWKAVAEIFAFDFLILGLGLLFMELVLKLSQPIALCQLITYYTDNEDKISRTEAYFYSGIIIGASFLNVIANHIYMLGLKHFGMKLRVAFCSVIYRKSLRLRKSVLGGATTGQMINLLSNDVNRCDKAIHHAHHLWVAPLETIITICVLYQFLGFISTIGIFFMVLFIPFQMYLGKTISMLRLKTALKTDERIKLMNEIISGIQVIKMFSWEKPFAKLVEVARKMEIRYIRGTCYIRGILLSFTIFTATFGVFLTILTYVLLGNSPRAEYVFVVTAFYNNLRQTLTKQFPRGITEMAEMQVTFSRIKQFLLYDEVQSDKINKKDDLNNDYKPKQNGVQDENVCSYKNTNVKVEMLNVSAKWNSSYSDNTLNEINFIAESKQLVTIIGQVGSGKTSLLHIILKELPILCGTLRVKGKISYASQEPWIFAGTIKQNIIFGQEMVQERYQEVIRVCALEKDLAILPYGDETLAGEKGVMLSGGQKARVNLARAIYKDADIYLLDDPLSAVDTHVGKQLFEECISKYLKNKCTILVTHQLQYLQNVNWIYLLEDGHMCVNGTYEEIRNSNNTFAKQLCLIENKIIDDDTTKIEDSKEHLKTTSVQSQSKEHRSKGHVSAGVYMSYFKSGGSLCGGLIILALFITTQGSINVTDYFLAYWVNMEQAASDVSAESMFVYFSRNTCLYIYSTTVAATLALTLLRTLSFFKYCMKASTELHNKMFFNIVSVPMLFFNTNSSGRVLNRFSKDIGSIDDVLPIVAIDCIQCALQIIGVTVMISLVNPWLLIVTGIITTLFSLLRMVYMKTSRSVKRLEGITRSPVFTHVNATLQGLTTIRAFEAQNILKKEFDDHQDTHSSVWYLFLSCSRAFGFWLDLICVGYIAIVTFSFFLTDSGEYGGNVGLAITQAMSLTGTFQWFMRQWTELENQMTSVERVGEYIQLEPEANPTSKTPPRNWPEDGNIDFVSVSLKYSSANPYILKNLNFSIKSNEKIGIVGRTGAGKSSLIYALCQLTKTEGEIIMDNIDITKIPLHNLRSKISIIPQEPVLFSGTLRKNLDPFNEYTDAVLWNSLEEVELKEVVADLPSGLNSRVYEGGSNFSIGQRQLLCLARAIMKKNKILILDEATANVDPQTDLLIQNTIRRKFANCTVLTIAHRLHTIMDSDKVLVMDAGTAVEFEQPPLLLTNHNTLFYGLVQETGLAMAENLTKMAITAATQRKHK